MKAKTKLKYVCATCDKDLSDDEAKGHSIIHGYIIQNEEEIATIKLGNKKNIYGEKKICDDCVEGIANCAIEELSHLYKLKGDYEAWSEMVKARANAVLKKINEGTVKNNNELKKKYNEQQQRHQAIILDKDDYIVSLERLIYRNVFNYQAEND